MTIEIKPVTGADVQPYFEGLAQLRIAVFREFPYLYDGTIEHEREYLSTYTQSDGALIVVALDGGKVVGMSTGIPARIFYFGESVLLPAYRGQGAGVRFFEEREAHAQRLGGFDYCTFCAVERPSDHPRRPADYLPLNAFWEKRGYRHHPELFTSFTWQDLDETSKSPKKLSFWMRKI
jgi:GNAT superfamily N-acetyltransferase